MNLEELRKKVLPIVQSTKNTTILNYGNIEFKQKGESAASHVTEVDIEVEEFLKSELNKVYPNVEFVGEETGGNRDAKRMWLCDPIDGTGNYIRGIGQATTMLAYIEDGEVIASVIYDFVAGDMYYAAKGEGAYLNDDKISVSDRDLKGSYIAYEVDVTKEDAAAKLDRMNREMLVVKNINAGYDFAMVASGKLDGRITYIPFGMDYDYAPGVLLVKEAGGVVANVGKTSYDYKNLSSIVANPKVYKELTEGNNPIFPIK